MASKKTLRRSRESNTPSLSHPSRQAFLKPPDRLSPAQRPCPLRPWSYARQCHRHSYAAARAEHSLYASDDANSLVFSKEFGVYQKCGTRAAVAEIHSDSLQPSQLFDNLVSPVRPCSKVVDRYIARTGGAQRAKLLRCLARCLSFVPR